MKLNGTKLCLQCDEVYEGDRDRCPDCGEEEFKWLESWLLPPEEKDVYTRMTGVQGTRG